MNQKKQEQKQAINENTKAEISMKLLNSIGGYLSKQPFDEVSGFLNELQRELTEHFKE